MEEKKKSALKATKRFEIMSLLASGAINISRAAEELSLSPRQIKRLKKRFITQGQTFDSLSFLRTHLQANKIPGSIREKIILLKKEGLHRSCQHISELLPPLLSEPEKKWLLQQNKSNLHLSYKTVERILKEAGVYEKVYEKTTPACRFEMQNFGELVQMDTSSFRNLCGYKRLYLILTIDDYSRRILAARFHLSNSVYNNMLVLREAIERYGLFRMLYTDNDSLFNYIRYQDGSRKVIRGVMRDIPSKTPPETITTEIEAALLRLGIPLLTHFPGHPRAKGKVERIFQFIERRFVKEVRKKAGKVTQLNSFLQGWINWYNDNWVNRDTESTPAARSAPSVFRPLPKDINLEDVFCLKETRKVDKTNSFSYYGTNYTIDHAHNLVAFTVELHIHPHRRIRVFHQGKFIQELFWRKGDIISVKRRKLPGNRSLDFQKPLPELGK